MPACRDGFEYLLTHEMATGYLVATLVFIIAAIVGLHIHINNQPDVNVTAVPKAPAHTAPTSLPQSPRLNVEFVATIGEAIDCRWRSSDANAAIPAAKHRLAIGDELALISGLIEILYDSGAKVILQGPCTYTIDSPAGGFLRLGKLTARVEAKASGGRKPTVDSPVASKSVVSGRELVVSGQWSAHVRQAVPTQRVLITDAISVLVHRLFATDMQGSQPHRIGMVET
jgi:hypothetical protein